MDSFFVSDKAFEYLIELASKQNFIPKTRRKAGLIKFLERLSYKPLLDTRPDSVKATDAALIESRHVPTWSMCYPRHRRSLELSDDTLVRYCRSALIVNLTMGAWYTGGPVYKSLTSITSSTLEAIGLQWLTPLDLPYEIIDYGTKTP